MALAIHMVDGDQPLRGNAGHIGAYGIGRILRRPQRGPQFLQASQPGCVMGAQSLRTAGLREALADLGWEVADRGDLSIPPQLPLAHPNAAIHDLAEACAWIGLLQDQAYTAARTAICPSSWAAII